MHLLLFALLSSLSAYAQNFTPNLDPNKFTICAITINSDDEKKIFQKEAAKYPKKFNPVVELTNLGDSHDWFDNACSSGIRCDQLVISGHFGGTFFGEKEEGKELSLAELEKKGCSKTCDGILNQPQEVFLMGCNTLAGKEADHRTPEQYYEVLLNDGISAGDAELVVQSRYGNIGDSNKAAMQRAFGGLSKKLYGFDSVGPSGKNVKALLENYFKKINLPSHLETMSYKRAVGQVSGANKQLAESLKVTAFAECDAANPNDEKLKKICLLQSEKESLENKLVLLQELLTQDDFLVYVPYVSRLMKEIDQANLSPSEKASLKLISDNQILKKQFIALSEKTLGLGFKKDLLEMNYGLGFITKEEMNNKVADEVITLLKKPLTLVEKDNLCSIDTTSELITAIQNKDLSSAKVNAHNINAYSCLGLYEPQFVKQAQAVQIKPSDLDSAMAVLDYLETADQMGNEKIILPNHLKPFISKMLHDGGSWGLSLTTRFLKPTPESIAVAKKLLNSSEEWDLRDAFKHLAVAKDKSSQTIKRAIEVSNDFSCTHCAIVLVEAKNPMAKKVVQQVYDKAIYISDVEEMTLYLETQPKIDRDIQEIIFNAHLKSVSGFRALNIEKYDPDIQEKMKALMK